MSPPRVEFTDASWIVMRIFRSEQAKKCPRFEFTDEQREALLRCWARQSDRDTAEIYLDAVSRHVGMWFDLYKDYPSSPFEVRATCRDFTDKLADLLRFMDENKERLSHLVRGQDRFEEIQITAAASELRNAARVLSSASHLVIDNLEVGTGPDTSAHRGLVAQLALNYRIAFGKRPSSSPGSNFRLFIRELSQIIGIQIGDSTIQGALTDDGVCDPPPARGWRIFKWETL